jgi:hypothetical protein
MGENENVHLYSNEIVEFVIVITECQVYVYIKPVL